jgi:hypothetical protein
MEIENLTPKQGDIISGCTDTEILHIIQQQRLSRIWDLMILAQLLNISPELIFSGISMDDKLDFNYGKWEYQSK